MKITKLEKSQIEIEGELSVEEFKQYERGAVKKLLEQFEMPGFRKGKVPEVIFRKEVGDMPILEAMAEQAISEHYPKILEEEEIDAIGRPEIILTKLAFGNPLGLKIKTAVVPEITLPNYVQVAKEEMAKEEVVTVEEADIEKALLELRQMKAHQALHEQGKNEAHDHHHPELEDEKNLPVLDDAFAKSLGNFANLDELRIKLKENLELEKKQKAHEKKRLATLEKIIEAIKVELPDILIESELSKMLARLESDIAGMGLKVDDYLTHIKKSREDLKKEWHKDATRRAILELALTEIAKKENITVPKEEVETEVKTLLERYPDGDPLRAALYIENVLRNEKVFTFLESQK